MTPAEPILERIHQLTEQNLARSNYSIDDLCRDLGISRSQLFRIVKEHSGLSPALYIRQQRLLFAQKLLTTSDLRIAEIADRIGMDSPQSFTKVFTQTFGYSPSEYRKQALPQAEQPEEEALVVPELDPSLVFEPSEPLPIAPEPLPAKRVYKLLLTLPLLILALAGGYFWYRWQQPDVVQASSVAVLPFTTPNAEAMMLTDGLMGQVHTSLASVEGIKVISKASSMLFRDTPKTIPAIARELNVAYVLTGNLQQTGANLDLSVELVQADDDRTLWTRRYQGPATNAVAFMNTIAREVAQTLRQTLSSATASQIDKLPTANWAAYQAFLEGQKLMQSREKAKLEASIERFDKAIALDTVYANAYAYRASAYFIMGSFFFMDGEQSSRLAEKSALKAIALDPGNGTAYAVLAGIYKNEHKWDQAQETYRIALKHSPNDAQINYWYSLTLRTLGRFREAIQYSRKAADLDPLSGIILGGYINSCSYAHDFTQAKQAIDRGALLFDREYMYFFARATYHLNKGEYAAAIHEFQKSDVLSRYPKNGSNIAFCNARLGRRDLTQRYLDTLARTPANEHVRATAYAGLNNRDSCFAALHRAALRNTIPDYFNISPVFAFLQTDPRYDALLRQFELPRVKLVK